ncbi:MAG: prepilin-type N-terminal cleavage/methylation domain-containing protein [Candidatus Hinthialibacter antarcticus]|nr:prepilin-type N-terminal cleavage/methylation domain-containing protein [Candidatus Hinthialibacter antarcticus]
MFRMSRSEHGFTLIELLIVVAIIGILAAIAVPNFLNAQVRAKIAKAEAEMRNVSTALESYRLDNNFYPPWMNENGSARNGSGSNIGISHRFHALTSPISYMGAIPIDPFIVSHFENQDAVYDTYDYVDAWSTVNWGNATSLGSSFRCGMWRLASAGPDATMSYGGVVNYTSSNGLQSWGDLVRVGPKASYPCDKTFVD